MKKIYTRNDESKKFYTITTISPIKVTFSSYENEQLDLKKNKGFVLGYIAYGDPGIKITLTLTELIFAGTKFRGTNFDGN